MRLLVHGRHLVKVGSDEIVAVVVCVLAYFRDGAAERVRLLR
jgi:hypothetical protein